MSIMPDLRYQIDITGLPSYPDLNISQIFDPPIYGYIVKIVPEKCEELIWKSCENSVDVQRYINLRYSASKGIIKTCNMAESSLK